MESAPRRIFRPLIPIVVALIIGITIGAWLPGYYWWFMAASMVVSLLLYLYIKRGQWTILLPLILCLLCGYLGIQPWLGAELPDRHVFHYVDKGYWKICGLVANTPTIQNGRWQFELTARHLANKDGDYDVCGRVRVTGRGAWVNAKVGDSVVFRGRLRSIRGFANPGGFDFERFMRLKGLRARVYASAKSLKIQSVRKSVGLGQPTDALRKELALRMDAALHPFEPDTLRLLKALLLGDRSGISPALRAAFNHAGVGHVLAISGLHVGMVATVSFVVARWLLAWIPLLIKLAWVCKGAAIFSLGPVIGYGLLAGLSPSTQRAMMMVTVFMLSLCVGRRHDWANTLALAALIILLIYPPALLSISFQLSFSAVLAIIAGSSLWPGQSRSPEPVFWKKMVRRLMVFLWISSMAILGTLPLVLHYFNHISLVGLVTNLIVVPLVGFIVVPLGLLGTLGLAVGVEIGLFFLNIAAWGADVLRWIVLKVSVWPWAAVHSVTPNGFEVGLYYLLGAGCLFWKWRPYGVATVAVVLTIIVVDAGYWIYQRNGNNNLRVTALDVGQAGGNLLELPGGYTILVDGGGFSDNTIFDVGAAVVGPLLWRKKIKTVDLVVLSHANSDHLNGLIYILKHFNVREVWSNQEPAPTKGYRQWVGLIPDRNIQYVNFEKMPRRVTRNGVQLEILSPPADFLRLNSKEPWRDLNNNSLVLRASYGNVSFLFAGDIMRRAEVDILARKGRAGLQSSVLLVPHHGSRSSSSTSFIAAVRPAEAVISAGWQNRFKFPHADVLERLESAGSRIWCTADDGAVEITTDGAVYEVRPYRSKER